MVETLPLQPLNTRRRFLAYFAGTGLSTTLFPGVLWAGLQEDSASRITPEMIRQAAHMAGLEFSEEEIEEMRSGVNRNLESLEEIRSFPVDMNDAPVLHFSPAVPGLKVDRLTKPLRTTPPPALSRAADLEEMAFWPLSHLASLIRTGEVTSTELTGMYLSRLKRYNPRLNCVVTFTEELALKQAAQADAEIKSGRHRGLLHGIPWGCKDIIAVKGYRTTWGAEDLEQQNIDLDAAVVERLRESGAVLIAKLSTGRLAGGDQWFGGRTYNPWDPEAGSSGSSAGPASATAAGLVGFAIGTETSGSILSPSTVCGVTGLRPTFGRISRYGVMTLSWSQDRLGPICRTAEDCAIVFHSICGPDNRDVSAVDVPFNWDFELNIREMRVGYLKDAFEEEGKSEDWRANEQKAIEQLSSLGLHLTPFQLPDFSSDVLGSILGVESAAFFDKLPPIHTERNPTGRHRGASRLVPAVEYIQAQRIRGILMRKMAAAAADFDAYVAPYFEMRRRTDEEERSAQRESSQRTERPARQPPNLTSQHFRMANLAGWPALSVPNGFTGRGTPTSFTILARPYGEASILALARAYQEAAGWHLKRPVLEG